MNNLYLSLQLETARLLAKHDAELEQAIHAAVLRDLPPRLKWLIDHPRLLACYYRLRRVHPEVRVYSGSSRSPGGFLLTGFRNQPH